MNRDHFISDYYRHFFGWLDEFETALRSHRVDPRDDWRDEFTGPTHPDEFAHRQPVDPRDPDPSRPGIFRDHNCARCHDGEKPCVRGNPRACEYPHARND